MGKWKSKWFSVLMAAVLLVGVVWPGLGIHKAKAAGPKIIYVKMATDGGNDVNDGISWATAVATLQLALDKAIAGEQIWIAAGTYYPTKGVERERHFEMKNGVAIYGGFEGNEDSDFSLDDRDYTTNKTILSGDFDGNDTSKAYHVFYHNKLGLDRTAILDGVTITGGNADNGNEQYSGGGMFNDSSSPTLTNVTLSGNKAYNGGGMYNNNSSPTITNVTISGNKANYGGGIYNFGSSPTLTNVTIIGNTADSGGGMQNEYVSRPTLTNVTISGNAATNRGGGVYNPGSGSPILINVTISGNTAVSGGGMYNFLYSSPILTNVTISGNTAEFGGGIYNGNVSNPNIRNSIIWDNNSENGYSVFNNNSGIIVGPSIPNINHSLIEGSVGSDNSWNEDFGVDGGGNIDKDPMFQDSKREITEPTTAGNYRLRTHSPAINTGDKRVFAVGQNPDLSGISTDLDRKKRIVGAQVDMGAYEYQTVKDLKASPATVNMKLEANNARQLFVEAILSDGTEDEGTEDDLTNSTKGTTYSSGDPTVATVTKDGLIVAKKAGTTTITISNSGVTTTVEVNVTSTSSSSGVWIPSGDAHLRELILRADGKTIPLTPVFAADTTEYRVETAALQVDLTGTAVHSSANVTMQGKTVKDGIRVDLHEGNNVFTFLVTAENGATKTYTLTVKRIKEGQEPPHQPVSFTDINGHWAEVMILQAATKGIASGYPDDTFRPNHSVTRAEFVVMLANTMQSIHGGNTSPQNNKDLDASLAFTDADKIGAWAKEAVAYAVEAGIVNGYKDGSFRPNARITRAEMAKMIAHALGLTLEANKATAFADDANIPAWAKSAIEATRKLGIVSGRGGNRFIPMGEATRAEAAVLLLRMLDHK
ncbi:S-layer homology domain-containing protein [Cohnella abietis]|uniref:SLH domain-containing protein n=1 Tax=Cohnella abietis TaxID=2507935 RepID=A0A3T1D3L3_9BACL|nr:S-layer homology domain-containing protein [Cohnella abietis]BBI32684.1 hypothetical protein KCTCHS21_20830 [Cohnella abietis]